MPLPPVPLTGYSGGGEIMLVGGSILLVGGAIAVSQRCCCTPACPTNCSTCSNFSFSIASATGDCGCAVTGTLTRSSCTWSYTGSGGTCCFAMSMSLACELVDIGGGVMAPRWFLTISRSSCQPTYTKYGTWKSTGRAGTGNCPPTGAYNCALTAGTCTADPLVVTLT